MSNSDEQHDESESSGLSSRLSLVGSRIGEYQVLRKLGRGGMADVYAARQISLGRESAIKVLRDEYSRDKDYIARFQREARAAAKLNHPNIVQVYEVGCDEQHFISQELVNGKNLKEVLNESGPLGSEQAIEVLVAVASALEAASDVGIIHRDVKPENIMRSEKGIIKVADFGLARLSSDGEASRAGLTQAGITLGTPRYMSPEQVQGKVADVRSDLYALGVTMYHLLSGRPPFEADDPLALAVLHLHETPEPLDRTRGQDDIPEWMIAIVAKLMSKVPADRFQSPNELLEAVKSQAAVSHKEAYTVGTAAATIRLQRASKQVHGKSNSKLLLWASGCLLVGVSAGLGYWLSARKSPLSVARVLVPEKVDPSESVEQQYLIAVTRDDVPGWEAVWQHFPPEEDPTNRNYYFKSLLQLTRLHFEQERHDLALRTVDQLLGKPQIPLTYVAIAWAKKCAVLSALGDQKSLPDAKRKLKAIYLELKQQSPTGLRIFQRVVSPSERIGLEADESE